MILAVLLLLPSLLFAQGWYNNPSANTFEISAEAELREFAELVNDGNDFAGKTIKLTDDIALTESWIPIGKGLYTIGTGLYIDDDDDSRPFKGIFDGQNYTISGLSVENAQHAGLFGYVGEGGQIKNVKITDSEIKVNIRNTEVREIIDISDLNYGYGSNIVFAGGLVAYYNSAHPIENCKVQAHITDGLDYHESYVGGLVGYANSRSLTT
jgi:hypothetical protein